MKIKNLLINKKAKVKLATFILAGTLASSMLTGCGRSKDNILEGTILENTTVITFNGGSKDIVKPVEVCSSLDSDFHYYSVTSGNCYSDNNCGHICCYCEYGCYFLQNTNIEDKENITEYLTPDEIEKAYNGNLTNEDIIEIITRITVDEKNMAKYLVTEEDSLKMTRKK